MVTAGWPPRDDRAVVVDVVADAAGSVAEIPTAWVVRRAAAGDGGEPAYYKQPIASRVLSVIIAIASCCLLACFFMNKAKVVKNWWKLPYIVWLVLMVYITSFCFVFGSSILQFGFGTDRNQAACSAAMFLCLGAYVTTKVFIYLFLVDRAYIVRNDQKPRLKSKLYLFNSFGMMGAYIIIVIMNYVFRISDYSNGLCVIGMQQPVMIPLITFDGLVNVYLTFLFLIPLTKLHSIKVALWRPLTIPWNSINVQPQTPNARLRRLAFRTFIGTCCTLVSSITNLTVLAVLNGEIAWLCLMLCNSDIFFSAIVVHWLTANEHVASRSARARPALAPTEASDETREAFLHDGALVSALKSPGACMTTSSCGLKRRNSIP